MEDCTIMTTSITLRRMPWIAASLAAAWLLAGTPVSAQVREGSFDRTLTVAGAVDLTVQAGSGQIRIQPGAAGSVRIAAKLKSSNSWTGSGVALTQTAGRAASRLRKPARAT